MLFLVSKYLTVNSGRLMAFSTTEIFFFEICSTNLIAQLGENRTFCETCKEVASL